MEEMVSQFEVWPSINLYRLRKTIKNLNQYGRFSGRNFNPNKQQKC
jgi:hypothetical protein